MASSNAKKKTSSRSAPKRSASGSARTKPAERSSLPTFVLISVLCIVLALLTMIGFFTSEGFVVIYFCAFIKGIMGYGFWLFPFALIWAAVLLLGKKQGAAAAALGSSLGDILGGFAFWAPWTFIIKFAMAYIAGSLIEKTSKIVSMTAGGLVMCAGYLVAERVMYGSWALAAVGIPWNVGQFAVGIAVALAAQPLLSHIPSPKNRSV